MAPPALLTVLRLAVALLFLAFNLLPLYGIRAWGWDAFQLLILYWVVHPTSMRSGL